MTKHILITNDDGASAPGLGTLARALQAVGQVTVIAPERNWSASGHSKTMHSPLRADPGKLPNGIPALITNGSPTDAIALGLMGLAEPPIHLVVTGINIGANLGHDVTYSGTVTAAIEATIAGVPALAISLDSRDKHADTRVAASFAAQLARIVLARGLPPKTLLNVNVPLKPPASLRGVRITRMGARIYHDELIRQLDPHGQPYFWIGGHPPDGLQELGTDIWALSEGYISITPIQLDFTAYKALEQLRNWGIEDGFSDGSQALLSLDGVEGNLI
ncbi:MAG: 5'/3'-nucleotidase SurE [Anaerolineae bacterium]|nr:5'/3'-nucleotidase SurE [Anaerolineae bacterium]